MAGGKHRPHASKTGLEDTIPCRTRWPGGKQSAKCREDVCGRLKHRLGRATTGCGSHAHVMQVADFRVNKDGQNDFDRLSCEPIKWETPKEDSCILHINMFTMYIWCRLLITCKPSEPASGQTNIWSDPDPNCLTAIVSLKGINQ